MKSICAFLVAVAFVLASGATAVPGDRAVQIGQIRYDDDGNVSILYGVVLGKSVSADDTRLNIWPASIPVPFDGGIDFVCPRADEAAGDLTLALLRKLCEAVSVGDIAYDWQALAPDPMGSHPDHYRLRTIVVAEPLSFGLIFCDGFESGTVGAWSAVVCPAP